MHFDRIHLLLDASGPVTHVGLLHHNQWLALYGSETPALESLFQGVVQCLREAALSLDAVKGFIYCDGPGSTLGLRLSAMALKTWRSLPQWQETPVYTYHRLNFAAALVSAKPDLTYPFNLITEFRQGSWHCLTIQSADTLANTSIKVLEFEDLNPLSGTFWHLPQRNLDPPPVDRQLLNYTIQPLPELLTQFDLLQRVNMPEPFSQEQPQYQRWTAQRHKTP